MALTVASGATSKSDASPKSARDTPIADADAASAATAMRGSKRWTSSSSTNAAPAIGALKAVARPAPAPAAQRARQSAQERRKVTADEDGGYRAQLHARPLPAERETSADRQDAANEFDREESVVGRRKLPLQNRLDMRNSAAGRVAREPSHRPRRDEGRRGADADDEQKSGDRLTALRRDQRIAKSVRPVERGSERRAESTRNGADDKGERDRAPSPRGSTRSPEGGSGLAIASPSLPAPRPTPRDHERG